MKQLTDFDDYSKALDALDVATTARASAQREVVEARSRVDAAGKAKADDTDEIDEVLAERAAARTALDAAQLRLEFADELLGEEKAAAESAKLEARRWILDDHQQRYNEHMDSISEGIEMVLEAAAEAEELRRASERAMAFGGFEQAKHRFKISDDTPSSATLEELRRWAGLPLPSARRLARASTTSRYARSL
jgi:chromosome segregation ATPase